jgi:transposase
MAKATREEWSKRIERWKDSGLSAKDFANETGISQRSLSWWRWQLGRKATEPTLARPTQRRKREAKAAPPASRMTFVEVSAPAPSEPFEIVLASGRRIRVPSGFDAPTLERLLVVLERSA